MSERRCPSPFLFNDSVDFLSESRKAVSLSLFNGSVDFLSERRCVGFRFVSDSFPIVKCGCESAADISCLAWNLPVPTDSSLFCLEDFSFSEKRELRNCMYIIRRDVRTFSLLAEKGKGVVFSRPLRALPRYAHAFQSLYSRNFNFGTVGPQAFGSPPSNVSPSDAPPSEEIGASTGCARQT